MGWYSAAMKRVWRQAKEMKKSGALEKMFASIPKPK